MSKAPRPSIDDSFTMDPESILKRARYLSKLERYSRFESSDSIQKNQSMPDLCEINENSSDIILMTENQSPLLRVDNPHQMISLSGNNNESNANILSNIVPATTQTNTTANTLDQHHQQTNTNIAQGILKSGENLDQFLHLNQTGNIKTEQQTQQQQVDYNQPGEQQINANFPQSMPNFEQINNWLDQTSLHQKKIQDQQASPKQQVMSTSLNNQMISGDLYGKQPESRCLKDTTNVVMHPNAPRISSPTESNSSISSFPSLFNQRTQDFSEKRFRSRQRAQNRDKFSVRVSNFHCSMDPNKDFGRRIFVTFQAQFPRQYPNTSNIHHVNIPQNSSSPIGVRLSLCCALDGDGPSLDDFKSPTIQDRLSHWESNYGSGKLGFCQEVLSSLKGTIEKILQKINFEGLNSIQTDVEYQFYPETGNDLVIIPNSTRTRHLSTSSDSGLLQNNQILQNSELKNLNLQLQNSGQKLVMSRDDELLKNLESLVNASKLTNIQGINSRLSQIILNTRATSNSNLSNPQIDQNKLVDYLVRQSSLQELSTTSGQVNATSSVISSMSNGNGNLIDLTANIGQQQYQQLQQQAGRSVCSSLVKNDSVQSLNDNQSILSKVEDAIEKLKLQSATTKFSSSTNVYQPQQSTGPLRTHNTFQKQVPVLTNTNNFNPNPDPIKQKHSCIKFSMKNIISEVSRRLQENPTMPLVILPGSASSSPDTNLPYIFQVNNPSSIVIGFPGEASKNHQPRVVTSPVTSTVVVTSDQSDPSTLKDTTGNHTTRVLPPPKPGFSLVINSRGQVFQLPESGTPK